MPQAGQDLCVTHSVGRGVESCTTKSHVMTEGGTPFESVLQSHGFHKNPVSSSFLHLMTGTSPFGSSTDQSPFPPHLSSSLHQHQAKYWAGFATARRTTAADKCLYGSSGRRFLRQNFKSFSHLVWALAHPTLKCFKTAPLLKTTGLKRSRLRHFVRCRAMETKRGSRQSVKCEAI